EKEIISTADDGWLTAPGPTLVNNIYLGEVYDSRREISDIGTYKSDAVWQKAEEDKTPKGALRLTLMPPCRLLEILPAERVTAPKGKEWEGVYIFDFGKNIAGNVRLRIPPCPAGTQITVRYGENLTSEGYVDYRSSGTYATMALQQDTYIAKGTGEWETWEPSFSYKGFRYAEISGLFTRNPSPRMAVGLAISTDLPERSAFVCQNKEINQLLAITRRTFRSNFHSYPEDCPAREKSGWLGDAQWCTPLWLYHFDSDLALEKYVDDLIDSYELYGELPMVSPGRRTCGRTTPLWGQVIVQIPYQLWKMRGKEKSIQKAYPYMRQWLDDEHNRLVGGLPTEGLGDWLPPVGNDSPLRVPVEQACALGIYEALQQITEIARHLGYEEDALYYGDFAKKLKSALNRTHYKKAEGTYGYDASDAAAICLGVSPSPGKTFAALCKRIEERDGLMTCGAWGNMYLMQLLAEHGRCDLALRVLLGKGHTNFASMMAQGATSLFERMENLLVGEEADKKIGSFNHPMHGACMKFLYDTVAGIRPLAPGFTKFSFAPAGYAELGGFSGSVETPQGDIEANVFADGTAELSVPNGTVCVCGEKELHPGLYRITL
ncbi:MAG: family 78 glycoside hydrolase catalytic domain, partial [Clostridia bacterium]|nr:family 78 glycoside hydrolase catalytic domain [Clostridia bacterium]